MELWIAGIVLFSAALHPVRDTFLSSDARPSTAYLGIIRAVPGFSTAHVILAGKDLLSILEVWPLLLVKAVIMAHLTGESQEGVLRVDFDR